ncbi:lipopolysaccharide heptosyltransferase I domain protein [Burkholderia cepacia]|nr:lipopolysaccharide heptosyltransferase I domain protein [Burkholderia cepacia]
MQRPTVMIFVATSRHHCGIGGAPNALSIGEPGTVPSVGEALDAIGAVCPAYGALRARLTA